MHGECCGNRNSLAFATRQGLDPAAPQRVDPDLIDHLLDALTHQRSRQSEILETKGELGLDILEHELRIGMLKDKADVGRELTWRMIPRIEAADQDPAAELAAGAVWNQAIEAAKQGRLSAAGSPPEEDHLAGVHRGRDVAQGRLFGLRVAIADGLKRDDGHGPRVKGWR